MLYLQLIHTFGAVFVRFWPDLADELLDFDHDMHMINYFKFCYPAAMIFRFCIINEILVQQVIHAITTFECSSMARHHISFFQHCCSKTVK